MQDKISAALQEGYSPAEVLGFLSTQQGFADKVEAARVEGYSDEEILSYLSQAPVRSPVAAAPAEERGVFGRVLDWSRELQGETNESLAASGMPEQTSAADNSAAALAYQKREREARLQTEMASPQSEVVPEDQIFFSPQQSERPGLIDRAVAERALRDEDLAAGRTVAEAANDIAAAAGAGLQQLPATVVGLIAPDSETAKQMQQSAQAAEGSLSPFLQARLAEAKERIQAAAEAGMWEEVKAAADEYLADPVLFSYFAARTMPSMVGVLGPAKLAQAAAVLRGASPAAIRAVTANTAGAANAVMTGGDARQQAYDTIYQALKEQGASDEEARERALNESVLSAGVGAGLGWFGGKYGAEAGILGLAGGRTALGRGAATFTGEVATELPEEMAPQLMTNSLASRIDGRNPLEGLGETAVQTVAGIGPMATIGGVTAAATPTIEEQFARDVENIDPAYAGARMEYEREAQRQALRQQADSAQSAISSAASIGDAVAAFDVATQATSSDLNLGTLETEQLAAQRQAQDALDAQILALEEQQTPAEESEVGPMLGAALEQAAAPSIEVPDAPADLAPTTQNAAGAALLGSPQPTAQAEPAREVPALLRTTSRPDGTMVVQAPIESVAALTSALGISASVVRGANNQTVVGAKSAPQVAAALQYALEPFSYSRQDQADVELLATSRGAKPEAVALVTPESLPAAQPTGAGRLSAADAIFLGRVLGANGRSLVLYRAGADVALGGAIIRGRRGKVFLNVDGDINPVAEVVHEVGHSIRDGNEGAYQTYLRALQTSAALDTSEAALITWARSNFANAKTGPVRTIEDAIKAANVETRDQLLEEFVMDATGRASREGKFWDTVFAEMQRENPSALKAFVEAFRALGEKLRRELFNRGNKFAGIERHIKDIDRLAELAGRYYAQGMKDGGRKVSDTHLGDGGVVTSQQRIGPISPRLAETNQAWFAKKGLNYEIETTPEGDAYLNLVGETDGQQAGARAGLEGRESVRGVQPQDPGQYQRQEPGAAAAVAGPSGQRAGYSRPAQRPSYGRENKPGAVTVVGTHFSRAQRSTLSGGLFGTGHTSAEAARLQGADADLRSRINFYVDEGNGVEGEVGTGSFAHEVELSNLYDTGTDALGLWSGKTTNDRELAIVQAGYDGYYVPAAFIVGGKEQGGVVLLGKRHTGVPVAYAGQPTGRIPAAEGAAQARTQADTPLSRAKALAAKARGLKGLPAGQMPASRWRDALLGVDEEVFQAFDEAGLFNTDETLYLSELAGRYVRQAMGGEGQGQVVASPTRNAETIDDHLLKVERDLRELAETTRLSAAEKSQIRADAKRFGFTIKELELEVRRIKSRFPPEAGWAPITFNKVDEKTLKKKATEEVPLPVDAIFFDKIAYAFHQDAKGKADKKTQATRVRALAQALSGEILSKYTAAQSGDLNGQLIMRQSGWYRELRSKLRATFGGFADYLAQLLGPTSANNPVEPNFRYATEALALATSGRWDDMIKEAIVWKADIEAAAAVLDEVEAGLTAADRKALKALNDEVQARFGKGNKSDERTEYIERRVAEISPSLAAARTALKDASVYKGREPLRDNGKRFGVATRGILEILADSWGDKKPGDAPKTKNYYQNIVGRTLEATIDVWAARTLRRLANEQIGNFPRIPFPAEQGVQGNILVNGDGAAGGEFGFGQDVFREAAEELRKSGIPEFANTNASEVQAMIWFAEKELWARRDWTTKIGEGGSIEHELLLAGFMDRDQLNAWRVAARAGQPKAPEVEGLSPEKAARVKAKWDRDVAKWQDAKAAAEAALREVSRYPDRFFAGATSEIPGDVPLDQEMASLGREVEETILSEPGVMAVRAQSSTGVFLEERERTLDIELTARNGYDVTPLAEKLREIGDREGQHATFLSRVLRPDEQVDLLRHRPGMELYFSEAISPAAAEELISVVQDAGFIGMTLATEGRRTPEALAGETQNVVGIRVQHIPEFMLGYGYDVGMTDEQIAQASEDVARKLEDLVTALGTRADVSTAEQFYYETEVNFYGDNSRAAEGTPREARSGAWSGRSVREGLERADRFTRERGSDALESRRDRVREERAVRRAGAAPGRVVASPTRNAQNQALASAFISLSNFDGVFQVGRSEAAELPAIAAELMPDVSVRDVTTMYAPPAGRKVWRISRGNADAFVTLNPTTGDVWLNVAGFGAGNGGSKIYSVVGNWAANNDYRFIGDPDGLSEAGKRRRLENLISLKLKFPRLDVRLHQSQREWLGDKFGVTLNEREDDSLHNLGEYLRASYEVNRKLHPEIEHAEFQPDGSFRDRRTGEPFDFKGVARSARSSLASGAAGGLGAPGDSTLRRAVLAKSILETATEAGGSGVGEALYALRDQSVSAPGELRDVLYSVTRNPQTETPEFKRWFGEWSHPQANSSRFPKDLTPPSQVVDDQGRPMIVYHATNNNFDVFETGRETTNDTTFGEMTTTRHAIFASPSIGFAEEYLRGRDGANVMPVYMNVKSPVDLRDGLPGDVVTDIVENSDLNRRDFYDLPTTDMWQLFDDDFGRQVVDALKAAGYDGAVMLELDRARNTEHEVWVAFDPEQIKSAIGNNGNFDPTNPDIRASRTRNAQPAAVFSSPALPDSKSKKALDTVVYQFQDRLTDLKAIQASIEAAGRTIRDEFNPYMQETLMHGKAAYRVNAFLEREMEPVLALMRRAQISIEDLNKYLHARHAKERNAEMAKRNPNQDELDQLVRDAADAVMDAEMAVQADPMDGKAQARLIRAQDKLAALQAAKPWSGTEEERQRLSGMSNDEARQILDRAHAGMKATAYRKLGEAIDKITAQTRAEMAGYGLESAETVAALSSAYQHYVPLGRDMEESELLNSMGGTGQGLSIRGSQVKRATGSLRAVENILANIVAAREATIVRGEKNRVAKALYGLVMEHPNPDLFTVIRPGMSEKQLRSELTAMGLDPDTVESMVRAPTTSAIDEKTGLAVRRVNANYSRLENAVVLRVNGEDRVVLFNKESDTAVRLVRALRNDDTDFGGITKGLMEYVGPVTRYLAAINTQYNPVFGLTNFSRDLQGAMLNLQTTELADQKTAVLRNVKPAFQGIWNWERGDRQNAWAKIYEEFLADGGATGYRDQYANLEKRANAIERELGQTGLRNAKGIKQTLDLLSDYNTAIENATRLAAYKAARDAGMSRAKAADLAKDVTVNFNRKGARSGAMASLYAFFNSAVQGSERTLRVLNSPAGRKIIAGGVALGAMQAVLGMLVLGDDWDEIPEFERAKHLIIPLLGTEQKYIKIPMPLGFHAIPNIGRSAVEMVFYRDRLGERALNLVATTIDAFNPLGSGSLLDMAAPSVADPLIQVRSNTNAFGRSIEREDFSSLAPTPGWTRAKEETSGVFKALSYGLNWVTSGGKEFEVGLVSPTPEMLSYLTGVVTGGLGREIDKVASYAEGKVRGDAMPAYKIPVVSRFYGEAGGDAVLRSKYYDAIKEINAADFAKKRTEKAGGDPSEYAALASLATLSRQLQSQISDRNKERQAADEAAVRAELEAEILALQQQLVEAHAGVLDSR